MSVRGASGTTFVRSAASAPRPMISVTSRRGVSPLPMSGDYAAGIDPDGMATQCDLLAAFEGTDNVFAPVAFNQQCATFLTGFLDDYVATRNGG